MAWMAGTGSPNRVCMRRATLRALILTSSSRESNDDNPIEEELNSWWGLVGPNHFNNHLDPTIAPCKPKGPPGVPANARGDAVRLLEHLNNSMAQGTAGGRLVRRSFREQFESLRKGHFLFRSLSPARTFVRETESHSRASQRSPMFCSCPSRSLGKARKMVGATGFEPATSWSQTRERKVTRR
jgi:hypothetical protein